MGRSISRRGGYTKPNPRTPKKASKGDIVHAQGTHVNRSDNAHGRGPMGGRSGKTSMKNPGPHGYS